MKTLNAYQEAALRTAPAGVSQEHDRKHALLGLISEIGEFADTIKKEHAYGKPIDRVNLVEELGDLMWYVALMCRALGTDLETVAQVNISKLRARYPHKFTTEQALNRDLDKERAVLEAPVGARPDEIEVAVQQFAAVMLKKLRANAHKGGREGWINVTPIELIDRIREETAELEEAVMMGRSREAINEAADIGNFAMMVCDWYLHTLRQIESLSPGSNPRSEVSR